MKILKYIRYDNFAEESDFYEVEMPWSEENEEIAKAEAHNGEYTVEDNGEPEPAEQPSQLDVIEAQLAYTAMMTDTLLEG